MKYIKYLIIFMFLFIGIKNISAFDNTIKVYDYAQVLTEQQEINLKSSVNKYIENNNMDMVIVTVKHYNNTYLNDYMNQFYNQNNFGIGTSKDGVIIVLDLKNNEDIGIKAFGLASTKYSDNYIKSILNKVNKEKDYYNKLFNIIEFVDTNITYVDNSFSYNNSIDWLSIVIVSFIIPTIVIFIGVFKNKSVKKEECANYYIKSGGIVISTREDKFITTNTKKSRINSK